MSAETLRRAAALMRERAKAATPSPWESLDNGDRLIAWTVESGPPHFTEDFEYIVDEPMGAANAEHIASWHPAVALAVADWLDDQLDAFLHVRPGNHLSTQKALAVARAYLAEEADRG